MAQVDKKAGLLKKSSASRKPSVWLYDAMFALENPAKNSPRFWEELFLMKVNLEYLEGKLGSLDGDEVMKIKDNINSLFRSCIQAPAEEHQTKVVNALQVGTTRGQPAAASISVPLGPSDRQRKTAPFQTLSRTPSRIQHGYNAAVLLVLLVNYRKYESVNPYIVKLSVVGDETTLNISVSLKEWGWSSHRLCHNTTGKYKDKEGFLSAFTNMSHPETDIVNSPSVPAPTTPAAPPGTTPPSLDSILKSAGLTRASTRPQHQTSNLLITFLKHSSIVMQDTKGDPQAHLLPEEVSFQAALYLEGALDSYSTPISF